MRRGGVGGAGREQRQAADVELAPVAQLTSGRGGAQRECRARLPNTASVCRPPGGAADTGRLCAACAGQQRRGGEAGFLPPSKRRPGLGLHYCQRAARHGAALTAMPLPRQHTSGRSPAVRVERIATAPMSRQQREQAITALAVLIIVWQHSQRPRARRGSIRSASASRPSRATLTTPQHTRERSSRPNTRAAP